MRKLTDLCLLCKSNAAEKPNSHILPKFLSKKFLGKKRRGYEVSSASPWGAPPRIIQDSPKEDYLICEECEKYMGVIETIATDTFKNWRYKCEKGIFSKSQFIDGICSIIDCDSSDKDTIRLLVYSMFWRSSISNDRLFNNMNLPTDFEDQLRRILLEYKATTKTAFLELRSQNPFLELFPFAIITAEYFTDDTANMLFVPIPANKGVYRLLVDQFSFILFESIEDIPVLFFKKFSNIDRRDCKIILFSQEHWQRDIIQPSFDSFADSIIYNTKNPHEM